LLTRLSPRIACSAGAACHSSHHSHSSGAADVESKSADAAADSTEGISHVLKAMNVPVSYARGTLRFSVGKITTEDEVDEAAGLIADAVHAELLESGKL
jgi:hypothetical protein